jgi:hypothetical protein
MKEDMHKTSDKQGRRTCDDESSQECSSGSEDFSRGEDFEGAVGTKRARRDSQEPADTFSELERFVTEYGLGWAKPCRFHKVDLSNEEGTDMSFLVLPLNLDQKFDIVVPSASSLNTFLETEQ